MKNHKNDDSDQKQNIFIKRLQKGGECDMSLSMQELFGKLGKAT